MYLPCTQFPQVQTLFMCHFPENMTKIIEISYVHFSLNTTNLINILCVFALHRVSTSVIDIIYVFLSENRMRVIGILRVFSQNTTSVIGILCVFALHTVSTSVIDIVYWLDHVDFSSVSNSSFSKTYSTWKRIEMLFSKFVQTKYLTGVRLCQVRVWCYL